MRAHTDGDGNGGHFVLSRRNLLTLLAKLDGHPPGSACTIMAPRQYGAWLVSAEENDIHYAHPDRQGQGVFGRMHYDTESAMDAMEAVADCDKDSAG